MKILLVIFLLKSLIINSLNNDTVTDTINDPDFIFLIFGERELNQRCYKNCEKNIKICLFQKKCEK